MSDSAFPLAEVPPLDLAGALPLYVQLAERLAAPIHAGGAALTGRALPTEAQCMAHFGVSRPTVRQAMARLVADGLVTRGRGRGTFVAPRRLNHDVSMAFEDEMRAARRVIRFEVLGRRTVAPSGRVREGLGLGPDDMVKHVERLRFLDGTVFAFERRWFHPAVARHVTPAMLEGMAIITLLGAALGQPPARIVNTVRCLPASPCCARLLGVPPRTSLLETEHTYYAASGAPLLHGSVRFHGERFEFTLDTPIRTSGRGAG